MNIYFAGIGGVGLGPLAEIAADAGFRVQGSDASTGRITKELEMRGIAVSYQQDGSFLRDCHAESPIDWLVYTPALPAGHPELQAARELGIKVSKRDELLARIINQKQLRLIAVAGTHGKTTTTGMLVWTLGQLGVPVSYSIGTTLSFGPSGKFDPSSRYFVYECDEFDSNFLHFSPSLSLITSVDYDHPDSYPTQADYIAAFRKFVDQSDHSIMWRSDGSRLQAGPEDGWILDDADVSPLKLAGQHNRRNAHLVLKAVEYLGVGAAVSATEYLENFPGTDRRFEQLANDLYSDYGHHPAEIAATLQLAREIADRVVLIYQPHQNVRQHEIRQDYTSCFELAEEIIWLPTYLSREDPVLPVLSPQELSENVTNHAAVSFAELDDQLWRKVQAHRDAGKLVLAMGAGNIDSWLREQLSRHGR